VEIGPLVKNVWNKSNQIETHRNVSTNMKTQLKVQKSK